MNHEAIDRIGKLHNSGPKGRKRWRVKYWTRRDPNPKTQYLGLAEGEGKLSKTEAMRLMNRWRNDYECARQKGQVPTLGNHIDHYLSMMKLRCVESSYGSIELTTRYLLAFFGTDTPIDVITKKDVDEFFKILSVGQIGNYVERMEGKPNQCKRSVISDKTLEHHLDNARNIFLWAIKNNPSVLTQNPFAELRIKPVPKKGTWKYVPAEDAEKAIHACTDQYTSRIGWQVFIGLQRYAGLRRGEALALEKCDINLAADPPLIKVYASKTARQSGKPSRVVPVLFESLELLLRQAMLSMPADPLVVDRRLPRHKGSDHKTLTRILKRAGLDRWRPGFQILRACAERDFLELGLSERLYTKAIGHSPEVSRTHYMEKFEDAVLEDSDRTEYQDAARQARLKTAG